MKKKIAILGSTGSIGTQALEVIEEHSGLYEAYILTANNQVDKLIEQARKHQPEAVVIANEQHYPVLKDALSDLPIKVYAGASGNADEVIKSYLAGTLAEVGEATCDHHDHEHQGAHDCGHGGCQH